MKKPLLTGGRVMIILVSRKKKEVMEFDYGRKANDEVFEKRLNKAFEEAKALILRKPKL